MAWQLGGVSVRGAAHVTRGRPNEDAVGCGRRCVVLADGHGSERAFRAEVGAALAVSVAVERLDEFLDGHATLPPPSEFWALPEALCAGWRAAVASHQRACGEAPIAAYGCTLVALMGREGWWGALQLGDGDVLWVPAGEAEGDVERPVPGDARLLGNETTSLSTSDAAADFRGVARVLGPGAAGALVAATDGYSNSFAADAGFLQVGADLAVILAEDGLAALLAALPAWLEETSAAGSGDDISVGVAWKVG